MAYPAAWSPPTLENAQGGKGGQHAPCGVLDIYPPRNIQDETHRPSVSAHLVKCCPNALPNMIGYHPNNM